MACYVFNDLDPLLFSLDISSVTPKTSALDLIHVSEQPSYKQTKVFSLWFVLLCFN